MVLQAVASQSKQEEAVLEESEQEGDTLDPQTGLFYRSSQAMAPPPAQQPKAPPAQPEQGRHVPHSTQLLQSKPAGAQPTSKEAVPQESKPAAPPPAPQQLLLKERPASGGQGTQAVVQVVTLKPPHTPQLPKLQQAPSTHNRPIHTQLSQPPPLQAHHPVGSDKPSPSQVGTLSPPPHLHLAHMIV